MSQPTGSSNLPATASTTASEATKSALATSDGKITVADGGVTKIAGLAAREVSGVHAMGGGASRAFGAIKQRIPGSSSSPNPALGVNVEVGETQAAIDLDITIEYGVSIADLGRSIQRNVKSSVERMTGLQVTEVNVAVDDVYIGEPADDETEKPPRVQ